MRPIRTIAPLALGLAILAVAGCQRPSDPTTTAAPTPTQVERAAPTTTPTRHDTPPDSPCPQAHPRPGVGDHRRAVAGHDPCPGQRAPRQRRCRPPAVAAVGRVGLHRLCPGRAAPVRPLCGAGGAGRLPGPLPPRRVGGHPVPGPAGAPRQRRVGRDPGRRPGELRHCQSTRFRSGALSCSACSARSTTRSTFYLALPAPTLTADPF